MLRLSTRAVLLFMALLAWNCPVQRRSPCAPRSITCGCRRSDRIRDEEHYAMRDGSRIYLWEKLTEGSQGKSQEI